MPDRPCLLVIDDDRKIAQAVTVRLRAAGCAVESTADGEAGLAAAKRQVPSAILLDLRIPKLDGLTVLAQLRADDRTRHVPVIVLSASVADGSKALDAGAFCFLPKPYDAQVLLTSIQAALADSRPINLQPGLTAPRPSCHA